MDKVLNRKLFKDRYLQSVSKDILRFKEGGLASLKNQLEHYAPTGEFLAYINKKEANVLKALGGSGRVVKEYKKRGGKYKIVKFGKANLTGLTRWFKEKWVNVCVKKNGKYASCAKSTTKYPYCRPSVRVTSQTPKTVKEISKSKLKKMCKLKKNKKKMKKVN